MRCKELRIYDCNYINCSSILKNSDKAHFYHFLCNDLCQSAVINHSSLTVNHCLYIFSLNS